MLYALGELLVSWIGAFRLLQSHAMLLGGGAFSAAMMIFFFLPRYWRRLPHDRGKILTKVDGSVEPSIGGKESTGKPTGGGMLIALLLFPVIVVFFPFLPHENFVYWDYGVIACIYGSMLFGYCDDRSERPWGAWKKGLLDVVLSFAAAYFLCEGEPMDIWLPLTKDIFLCPVWLYVLMGGSLIWFVTNSTNCSDGVDGLAGSLLLVSFVFMSLFLYVVIGHRDVAEFLFIPASNSAAKWAVFGMIFGGGLAGYLWYNAYPSAVLMGDAGSRMLGTALGVLILVSGNPFVVLIAAPVVLINGGTGMVKLATLRIAKKLGFDVRTPQDRILRPLNKPTIPMFDIMHRWRFPLHDHCRKKLGWQPTQVMVRFVLIQLLLIPLLFLLLIKIR